MSLSERNERKAVISPELLNHFLFNNTSTCSCPFSSGRTITECHQCDGECSIINEESDEILTQSFTLCTPEEFPLDEFASN